MNRLFMIVQLINLVIFTLVIYDRKHKPGVKPLMDTRIIKAVKLTYLLPIFAFAWSLFIPAPVSVTDWICLVIAVVGAFMVLKGKLDLGKHHTWAGYYLPHGEKIHRGIYHWLSHPMYIGVCLVMLSCSLVYITRLPWLISLLALLCCSCIVAFLILAAHREDKMFLSPQKI